MLRYRIAYRWYEPVQKRGTPIMSIKKVGSRKIAVCSYLDRLQWTKLIIRIISESAIE